MGEAATVIGAKPRRGDAPEAHPAYHLNIDTYRGNRRVRNGDKRRQQRFGGMRRTSIDAPPSRPPEV